MESFLFSLSPSFQVLNPEEGSDHVFPRAHPESICFSPLLMLPAGCKPPSTFLDYSIGPSVVCLLPCGYYLYFTHEETKAQRGQMTLRIHSKYSRAPLLCRQMLAWMARSVNGSASCTWLNAHSQSHTPCCYQECSRTFLLVQETNTYKIIPVHCI